MNRHHRRYVTWPLLALALATTAPACKRIIRAATRASDENAKGSGEGDDGVVAKLDKYVSCINYVSDPVLDEMGRYAGWLQEPEKAEAFGLTWGTFQSKTNDMLKAGRDRRRRLHDRPFDEFERKRLATSSAWMVDGSPAALIRSYNDLVSASNGLQ
jgi:hypothetical protein